MPKNQIITHIPHVYPKRKLKLSSKIVRKIEEITVRTPIEDGSTIFLRDFLEGLLIEFSAGGLLLEKVL